MRIVSCLLPISWLAACAPGNTGSLSIVGIETGPFRAPELVMHLVLPDVLREGLERGVPLNFRLDLESDGKRSTHWRELRYLPLLRQYQVREPAREYDRSFSSHAAALSALERWPLPGSQDALALSARVRLDTTRLPAPLVLPAVFDRDWLLDTGVKQWPDPPR
jgi:hypothetical protein